MSRKLKFEGEPSPKDTPDGKRKKPRKQEEVKHDIPDIQNNQTADAHSDAEPGKHGTDATKSDPADQNAPDSKLKFSKQDKKISGLEGKSEKIADKPDKAQTKIPTKKVRKKVRVYDESTQKFKTKLTFDEVQIPTGEAKWNTPKKKSLPRKAVGSAATMGVNKLHSKVYEVEHENVGTQAAHKGELLSESAFRGGKQLTHSAYRHVKNTPYRKVSKLEVQSIKTDMKLNYQKALRDNPKLQSNSVSRFWQKRSIKKEYAAALKNAKGSAKTVKKATGVIQKATHAVTAVVRKIGLLMLLMFAIIAMFSMSICRKTGWQATGMSLPTRQRKTLE